MTRSSTFRPATTLRKTSHLLCLGALVATTQLAGCGDSAIAGHTFTPGEKALLTLGALGLIILGSNGSSNGNGGGSTCPTCGG